MGKGSEITQNRIALELTRRLEIIMNVVSTYTSSVQLDSNDAAEAQGK